MITQRSGWWVPEVDRIALKAVLSQVRNIDVIIMPFVKNRKCCIQAGGNIGIWPKKFSELFDKVYTFEADPENYEAMVKNLEGIPNIESKNLALGAKANKASVVKVNPQNVGAHFATSDPNGQISMVAIDDLNIQDVSLIQFDIEGGEYDAIMGSLNTIKKYNPTIVLEIKGFNQRYNHTTVDVFKLMFEILNYKAVRTTGTDWVFVKE